MIFPAKMQRAGLQAVQRPSALSAEPVFLDKLNNRMRAQRDRFGNKVPGSNQKTLITVDPELDLETRFASSARGTGFQECRSALVYPKTVAALRFFSGHRPHPRRALRIENQLHRLLDGSGEPLSDLENRQSQVRLTVVGGFNDHASDRLLAGIGGAAMNQRPKLVIAFAWVNKSNGIVVLDMVMKRRAGDKGGSAAGNCIKGSI